MIYDVRIKVENVIFTSSLRIHNHTIPFCPTLQCGTTDIHKWTSKNHPLSARKKIFQNFPHNLRQWNQCTYPITFFSDKAHNIYRYFKYIKLTKKREYVRREMKKVSYVLRLHHRTENQASFKRAVLPGKAKKM